MSLNYYTPDSPKPFSAYSRREFDLESGLSPSGKTRKAKSSNLCAKLIKILKSIGVRIQHCCRQHPLLFFGISMCSGITVLIILPLYEFRYRTVIHYRRLDVGFDKYPFAMLKNLVMVAGHSVYTSNSCGNVDREDSWFLESYQKHPGQAATFVTHIKEGIEIAAKDDGALLLFSGGETRKDAGPRSEAQSYWSVAESKGWFGNKDGVRWRALTEEHARDSFENLLFSMCRFRELTGTYPTNITVVSYDFKEGRFAGLHRSALRFPESRFFYQGTPASTTSIEGALKGEAFVRK